MSAFPDDRDDRASGRPSDAEPQPDVADDGALSPGSTATGGGTGDEELVSETDAAAIERDRARHPEPARPGSLVEHGRVATAEDME